MTAFGGALTDPTKIMGSRIGAYAVDLVLGIAVVVGTFFLFGASHLETIEAGSDYAAQRFCDEFNGTAGQPGGGGNRVCFVTGSSVRVATGDDYNAIQAQFYAAWFGFGLLNYVVLSAVAGGTLGKLLFGLRVTTARGQRAGIGRNLVRWLFLIIDAACCWLPGLLTSFNSKGHRRIGDMVAGTYVVHRSAEGRLLSIPGHLVVRNRQDPYVQGATPPGIGAMPYSTGAVPAAGVGGPDGIDAPVFDPSRNTYVRYDQASGTWFQWDERSQSWVPAQQ